jgi:methyl-accepting chemotaxis protein
MPRFIDMSLRVRTFAAFGLVLLVTIGLGIFALYQLGIVVSASNDLGGKAMPSLSQSSQILVDVINFRREEANRLLSVTDEDGLHREKLMADYSDHAKKIRAQYHPATADEQAEMGQFDTLWPQYMDSTQAILAKLKDHDADAAHKLYVGDNRVHFDTIHAALDKVVEQNTQAGRASYAVVNAAADQARLGVIIALVVATCLALAAGLMMVVTTASPIQRLTGAMEQLSKRNLATAIPDADRRDEIGAMARTVEVFKTGLVDADRLAAAQTAEEAAKTRRAAAIDALVSDFDASSTKALEGLGVAATELDTTAQSMSAIAKETTRQTTSASAAAAQTTANVESVAAAAEQMASSIAEISRQVVRSKQIADRASDDVRRTNSAVSSLTQATEKIGEVLTLIQAIAAQTNLLALNATIEAARAGEVGKGFAVVAAEVKGLANQTAKATEDIATQIAAVQKDSTETSIAIQAIGKTIEEVNEISTSIAAAMEEQGASTSEISRNAAQAAVGTREVAETMTQVTDAAGQSGAASVEVLRAAGDLSRRSESLQSEVAGFLNAIKAA